MIMLSIFAMTALVFLSRYLFLEPKLPLRLAPRCNAYLATRGLQYSPRFGRRLCLCQKKPCG